jgi:hypothetical protein
VTGESTSGQSCDPAKRERAILNRVNIVKFVTGSSGFVSSSRRLYDKYFITIKEDREEGEDDVLVKV